MDSCVGAKFVADGLAANTETLARTAYLRVPWAGWIGCVDNRAERGVPEEGGRVNS